jgi:hypothetical protein
MKIFKVLLATLVCCSLTNVWALKEVHVETAGTLSTLVSTTESDIKLTGSINGTDVKYLRQMTNEGSLTSLDMADVKIVSGGEAYFESYTTENNVIGHSMFKNCKKLANVVLPNSVNIISTNAFSGSGIKKADIPNSVVKLGGDAFAYCNSLTTVVIGSRVAQLDQGVFYSSAVKTAYVKMTTPPSTPAYLFSSSPTIYVYTDVLNDYKSSSWASYGKIVGGLENYYEKEKDPADVVNELAATYFEDVACTTLKAEYQSMSDEQLTASMTEAGMPDFMVPVVLKIKNNSWAAYEKDFRIHSYNAFSDANYWNTRLKSTGGSFMGNPTGIYSADYAPIYVFVDSDVPEDATLYLAGCVGNALVTNAKMGKKLVKGLNVVDGEKDALYYVVYTADTKPMTKTLSEWPDMKIHIEGGVVNGYYDVTRHSDADYVALRDAATHECFTIKGSNALFNFKTSSYKTVWPSTIDKSISWFDSLTVWHKELMGLCESVATGKRASAPFNLTGGESYFPIYYNNPNFAIEGNSSSAGYANSSSYRTCYNSVECIRNSFDVSRYELDDWCANHECGHNNQGAIKLEGGTEVSNNLFANVVRFYDGLVTSSGSPMLTTMNDYANHVPYYVRSVDTQLRMFYQLYLYYHQAQMNTSFYPELFKALRDDPLELWNNTNNSGLKFVRKVCEVAQEDLTEFFDAWGFFEPCRLTIDDYGTRSMTVNQSDIDITLDEISKYPKKNRQILFIEDRVDYVLTTDFLTTAGNKRRDSDKVGQCGDLGQFTEYLPGGSEPSNYTYLQSDSLFAMLGTGGIGFMVRNSEGKMLYASNAKNFCLPTIVGDDYTIYSVDVDGSLHETTCVGSGTETVKTRRGGVLSDTLSQQVIKAIVSGYLNSTDVKYLRGLISDGNLASFDISETRILAGGSAYDGTHTTSKDVIGTAAFQGFKQLISVKLPSGITRIEERAFANSGLKEIVVPDGVTSIGGDAFAYCESLTKVVLGPKVKTLNQGVFYSSPVKEAFVRALTPPNIAAYLFSSKPVIHVYASALADYQNSKWAEFGTLVGDLDDYEYMFYAAADVNRDNTVDSADIVAVIKEMPDGDMKADVNRDGIIDSADIVAVIKAMK